MRRIKSIGDVAAGAQTIVCVVDQVDVGSLTGWAFDPTHPEEPVRLHFVVDGIEVGKAVCDLLRGELGAAGFPVKLGFRMPIPEQFVDGRRHRLELRARQYPRAPLSFVYNGQLRQFLEFSEGVRPAVWSRVDDVEGAAIVGWVLRESPSGDLRGGDTVMLLCPEELVGYAKADRYRPDVAGERNADAFCGFRFVLPTRYRRPRPQTFRILLLPERIELSGSPIVTSFIQDVQARKAAELMETIERLEKDIGDVRRLAKNLLPQAPYTVDEYEEWARLYFDGLRARTPAPRTDSLISILCPTYCPLLSDFTAAVESVIAQTYANWELIIVDDGSRRPDLRAQMRAFAARDPRIRVISRRSNGGISRATNTALAAARGAWVVFFDHDDVLVDVALQTMLAYAESTSAHLLFSDEDKIDAKGHLTEPHFKPDWNHRLLLGNNYLGHLVMTRREILTRIRPLNPEYDGAQDHDLLLRLTEVVEAQQIRHVPEVLYHWRKAGGSTAASLRAKPYAIEAGLAAVRGYIERRGCPAVVSNLCDSTLYRVSWQFEAEPRIAIVVPFKDAAAETRRCISALLETTGYPNFRILLVDNWSTEPDSLALVNEVTGDKRVQVLRVEEQFNYSRLNNRAIAETDAEFVVLHNNDVFHSDPHWLRRLLNEALWDSQVAIVGAKLLYASGSVQHAGVVLGLMGVAGHLHNGFPGDAPGYAGRAILTQEMSAVTGACMLVRRSVFREMGGLDEALAVAFNDVDFCLRARAAGYKVIFAADCVAEHRESLSRGADDQPLKEARFRDECRLMQERWGELLQRDAYYSRHFDLDGEPLRDLRDPE